MATPYISSRTAEDFANDLFKNRGRELLEESIDFIKNFFAPDDVFDYDQLRDWAKDNGFVEEE